jgi:hypothetical protein
MSSKNLYWFDSVLSRPELIAAGLQDTVSARTLGNVVLVDRAKNSRIGDDASLKTLVASRAAAGEWEVLRSQFIDQRAANSLIENRGSEFVQARAQLMYERASELVNG